MNGTTALIVGAGSGLSASLARQLAGEGVAVGLAARTPGKLETLARSTGAKVYACDVSRREDVPSLIQAFTADLGTPDLVVYNPSYRTRGPFVDLDPVEVERTLMITCYGGFLVGQAAARAMLGRADGPGPRGSIFFTGASASVKGYPESAPFAMGKFGLRGLAESMARELQPKNIHIAHFVIDGGIRSEARASDGDPGAQMLDPEAIARTYLDVYRQDRSAWTSEVALRPWVERF